MPWNSGRRGCDQQRVEKPGPAGAGVSDGRYSQHGPELSKRTSDRTRAGGEPLLGSGDVGPGRVEGLCEIGGDVVDVLYADGDPD